jgi:hypothetical protein
MTASLLVRRFLAARSPTGSTMRKRTPGGRCRRSLSAIDPRPLETLSTDGARRAREVIR